MGIFVSGDSTMCYNFFKSFSWHQALVCGMGNQKVESTEAQDLTLIERNYWSILEISSIQDVSSKALPG